MSGQPRNRGLNVEVRVGDYNRDNTNFFAPMMTAGVVRLGPMGVLMPVDDNYDEIRRQFWLATDSARRQATDGSAAEEEGQEGGGITINGVGARSSPFLRGAGAWFQVPGPAFYLMADRSLLAALHVPYGLLWKEG